VRRCSSASVICAVEALTMLVYTIRDTPARRAAPRRAAPRRVDSIAVVVARRSFLRHLMESVAENDTSVILSSHLVSDLERVCDYLIVLVGSRVQLASETEDLLEVIWAEHTDRQSTFTVRTETDMPAGDWAAEHPDLEDLVLTYMERAADPGYRGNADTTGDAR
jgi:ABC-2 type transport system ATP-binding protein